MGKGTCDLKPIIESTGFAKAYAPHIFRTEGIILKEVEIKCADIKKKSEEIIIQQS
jgi:hypothetical protein